jgi:hypothetical protein
MGSVEPRSLCRSMTKTFRRLLRLHRRGQRDGNNKSPIYSCIGQCYISSSCRMIIVRVVQRVFGLSVRLSVCVESAGSSPPKINDVSSSATGWILWPDVVCEWRLNAWQGQSLFKTCFRPLLPDLLHTSNNVSAWFTQTSALRHPWVTCNVRTTAVRR